MDAALLLHTQLMGVDCARAEQFKKLRFSGVIDHKLGAVKVAKKRSKAGMMRGSEQSCF